MTKKQKNTQIAVSAKYFSCKVDRNKNTHYNNSFHYKL